MVTSRRFMLPLAAMLITCQFPQSASSEPPRVYRNRLQPIPNPQPLLADYPEFVQPVLESRHFEAPRLIDDADATISVRAWRFSYNARGIIEVPNHLDGSKTALIMVHPWGVDDGQGWRSPQPAGVAFGCTPEKNQAILKHSRVVINPLLKKWRDKVGLVLFSLPRDPDPIRTKLYRSTDYIPTQAERRVAAGQLTEKLNSFDYRGQPIPGEIMVGDRPVVDYFKAFPGIDSSAHYNNEGFWELPIPVMKTIKVEHDDVVLYDNQGYDVLRTFLEKQGIEHVLLCGYATDMCICSTTAGYENLREDFNVFLIGDATQSTLPANTTARYATNQSLSYASLNLFITQVSWIKPLNSRTVASKRVGQRKR